MARILPPSGTAIALPPPSLAVFAHSLATLELGATRRRALGLFLRHLAHGERVAQTGAMRQARIAPSVRAARFLRSQARHEALHARIFDVAALALGAPVLCLPACPYAAFDTRLAADAGRGDYPATLVGTQLVLEALGEILLERLEIGLVKHGAGFVRLRRLFRAQEAAHHAFGVAELADIAASTRGGIRELVRCLPPYRLLAGRMIDAGTPVLGEFGLAPEDIGYALDARVAADTAT